MQVTIRPYRESDLERLQEITVEGFEGVSMDRNIEQRHGIVAGRDWKWRKARHIQHDAERDPAGIFVAEADNDIAGYITTWMDADTGTGFIPNLAVDSRFRGEGIGRKLIEHALDHFRKQGMKYARIETLDQNPIGQKLYPSCGFEEIARQIHYGMPLE